MKSKWARSEIDVKSKWIRSEIEVKSKWNRIEPPPHPPSPKLLSNFRWPTRRGPPKLEVFTYIYIYAIYMYILVTIPAWPYVGFLWVVACLGIHGTFSLGSLALPPLTKPLCEPMAQQSWLEIFGLGSLALHLWYWTFGLGSWALNRWLRIFLKFAVFWFLSKLWLLGLLAGVDVCIPYIWAKAQAWRVGDANAAAMPSPPPSSLWARSPPIQHIGLCGIGYGPTSRTRSLSEPRFISFAGSTSWSAPTSRGLVVLEVRRYSRTPLGIKNWVTKLNFKFAK